MAGWGARRRRRAVDGRPPDRVLVAPDAGHRHPAVGRGRLLRGVFRSRRTPAWQACMARGLLPRARPRLLLLRQAEAAAVVAAVRVAARVGACGLLARARRFDAIDCVGIPRRQRPRADPVHPGAGVDGLATGRPGDPVPRGGQRRLPWQRHGARGSCVPVPVRGVRPGGCGGLQQRPTNDVRAVGGGRRLAATRRPRGASSWSSTPTSSFASSRVDA